MNNAERCFKMQDIKTCCTLNVNEAWPLHSYTLAWTQPINNLTLAHLIFFLFFFFYLTLTMYLAWYQCTSRDKPLPNSDRGQRRKKPFALRHAGSISAVKGPMFSKTWRPAEAAWRIPVTAGHMCCPRVVLSCSGSWPVLANMGGPGTDIAWDSAVGPR